MRTGYKTALAKAAVTILRPLIKILIKNEFTHAELTELVRQTYVEVAYDSFVLADQKMTYSRAAVLTGLSRKEVVRLHSVLSHTDRLAKQSPNRAMRVVHGWLSDNEFVDENKHPLVLPVKGRKGSFSSLVAKYSGDITYGAVLDELNNNGVTVSVDENSVRLVSTGYVPHEDELEKVRIMSVCVSDLFGSAVHNIDANDREKRFQRQLVYSGIEDGLAAKFHQLSSDRAVELFAELNSFLTDGREKSEMTKRIAGKRVGLGIYYFEGDTPINSVKLVSEHHG